MRFRTQRHSKRRISERWNSIRVSYYIYYHNLNLAWTSPRYVRQVCLLVFLHCICFSGEKLPWNSQNDFFYFPIFFKISTMVYPVFWRDLEELIYLQVHIYAREFVIATRMSVQHDWHSRSVTPFVLVCFNRLGNIGTAIFYLSVASVTAVYWL